MSAGGDSIQSKPQHLGAGRGSPCCQGKEEEEEEVSLLGAGRDGAFVPGFPTQAAHNSSC